MKKTEKTKPLSKLLSDFTYSRGYDISRVFDDFLRYIIWAHTMPEYGKPLENWPYKPEEGKEFFGLYQALVLELQSKLFHVEWYDIFGEIYEDLIAGKSRRDANGQFFTPPCLCDLMTELSNPKDKKITGKVISDPTSGSGRNLLAFHAKHPGNYMVAEDIDRTCAMMTVCNFILHGVVGEVIWHNTLFPDSFYGAWRVNENLNHPLRKYAGLPHVRPMEYEETFLAPRPVNDDEPEKEEIKIPNDSERIKEKLTTALEKQRTALSELMRGNLPKEEKKKQTRLITQKMSNLKKLLKKYE